MADLINFTLPSISENTDANTLKQIKNYLFQLTEQMKFYLNNIDSDNFTDAYNLQLSRMANAQTTNSQQLSVTQQALEKFKAQVANSMQASVDRITGNSGGYIVLHDTDKDGFPDEFLIMNTSDINTATKIWRWNQNGLMYNNGGYYDVSAWNTTVAIDMEGHINANFITTGILNSIEIRSSKIYGAEIYSAYVEAQRGQIGAFKIDDASIFENGGLYADYNGSIYNYRVFVQPAFFDSGQGTAANTWVFSTQTAITSNGVIGSYDGTFIVYADGRVEHNSDVYLADEQYIRHGSINSSKVLIGTSANGNLIIGSTSESDINAYTNSGGTMNFCYGDYSKRIYMNITGWNFQEVDTAYTNRYTISATGPLVLDANENQNALYLNASTVHAYKAMKVHGALAVTGALTAASIVSNSSIQGTTATISTSAKISGFTLGLASATFPGVDTTATNRYTITSASALVLNANNGNNALYLNASTVHAYRAMKVHGALTADTASAEIIYGDIVYAGASKTIEMGRKSITIDSSTANRDYILSSGGFLISANNGNNYLFLHGSTIRALAPFKCDYNLSLNFSAASGTVPIAVNTSGTVVASTSSERYKENITEDLDEELNPYKLYDLPIKQYNYKKEYKDIELAVGTQIGITAEDIEKYYPNALIRNKDGQAESWQERILMPAILKLVQEQKKQLDLLEEKIKIEQI